MAAIFQIRRGSGSVSLVDGELYLHKSSGSLQVSLGDGNPITLARLDEPNSGSLHIGGDITASNAYFSGDVAISGNLYLGNAPTDNISALGQFTTNLVPTPTNTIDVGTPTAIWRNIYATTFSGSLEGDVLGLGNPAVFSASVDDRLDQLQLASASLQIFSQSEENKNSTLQTYTSSVNSRLDQLQLASASLQNFTSSQEEKNLVIAAYTASMNTFTSSQEFKDVVIGEYTSSMNSFTSSTNGRLTEIELYTSSLKSAIDVTGGDTRILGNLIVDGTQTSLNTTETFIEDKSITLASGSTNSAIADGAGLNIAGANVSMSWDNTNTRLYFNTNVGIEGSISSSTIVGLNNDSVETYSASVDSRLSNLQSKSASVDNSVSLLGQFTQSQDNKNSTLQTYTASVDSDLTIIHIATASLNDFTASIAGTNEFTASTKIRLNNLETTSASVNEHIVDINTKTGSFETKFDTIGSVTSSLNNFTSSQEAKDLTLEIVTSSLNLATASFNSWTGSTFSTFSTSVDSRLDDVEYMVTVLDPGNIGDAFLQINAFTASSIIRLNNIEAFTSSIDTTIKTKLNVENVVSSSAQVLDVLTSLNSYSASLKNAITVSGTDVSVAGNLTVLGTTTVIDTTTLVIKDNIIELNGAGNANAGLVVRDATGTTTSGSLLWDTTNDYWVAGPLGAESKLLRAGGDNVVSSSAQITPLLPIGTVSGSSQVLDILTSLNSFTSSLDATYATEAEVAAGYEAKGSGIFSGSSQVNFTQISGISNNIVSASTDSNTVDFTITNGNITANLIGGVVSGSSQIDATSTTNWASGIKTQLDLNTVVSGSSQITAGSTTNFSNDVKTQLNANTVISGSSQVVLSSTNGGGTSANVQFGSLGIGTAASGVSGEIRATGDITAFYSSDIRLKENIVPIPNALEKINQISGNTYDWKEGYEELHSHKGNDVGVIAQEIEAILPQIVTNRDTGFKAVQYEKIIPLLIEAIKELSAKVDRLENK